MQDNRKPYKEFAKRKEKLAKQYDENYSEKQHNKGKLTAKERLDLLFDKGSFHEIGAFIKSPDNTTDKYGDGVICGYGTVNGRKVMAFAQDFSVLGGSLGFVHAQKIQKVQQLAVSMGHPIVGLIDSGGARIQEGIASLAGYAGIFKHNVKASGIVPQISVILGPAAGGAVYSPALTDFRFMVKKTSHMFVTGPQVVKEVLNEGVSFEDLGGAEVHSTTSGVADFAYNDEEHCILGVKKLLSFLPSNHLEQPPILQTETITPDFTENISKILPDDPSKPYDIIDIIDKIVDKDSFFEVGESHAQNIVTGFARLNNNVIGIIANQPKVIAGTLDISASRKAARFVRFCDAFNIPILVLEDVPGFLPGENQEHNAIILHGAKLLYAFAEATVPKITVIIRKAYGGAYIVMNSKNMGGDMNFAWPTAEIAVMGPDGAIKILNRKELLESDNPEQLKKELTEDYKNNIANPFIAEEKGYVDEVIEPSQTREVLISAFSLLENKYEAKSPRKHGNIPM